MARIARAVIDGTDWLCQLDQGLAVPLVEAPNTPGVDPLRLLLAAGTDPVALTPAAAGVPLESVTLLSPVTAPQKILAIGLNYADHARESGIEPPKAPVMFVKTPNSIVGPDADVEVDADTTSELDWEVELAAVIGRRARRVSTDNALDHVFGYTICNDISARDAQFADGQWVRGKSFDAFCPLGPWIVTSDELPDPQALAISSVVSGEVMQDSSTKEMLFSVAEIVSYLSTFMTLEPGDVIATGTPFGVGFARTPPRYLHDGDVVECIVEGIGTLSNTIRLR